MSRIHVIGGGVVGLSSAVALARAGHEVALFEMDGGRQSASWSNAGHIATEQVAPLASPATLLGAWKRRFAVGGAMDLPPGLAAHWLPFALRFVAASSTDRFEDGCDALRPLLAQALPAWRRLAQVLGRPELLRESGHLICWESEASAARGRAAWEAADTGTARVHPASTGDLARLRSLTGATIPGAVRFEGSAHIADLGALADALETTLLAAGGRIVRERADVVMEGARATVPGHPADLVLVAAGARSASLVAPAGHKAPLIAERGYHIRAGADDWPADMPPIVFEDRSMIVTRFADCVQAASFVEFGSVDAPADPRKWQRLEAHVAALGLPMKAPFTRWMGARPTLPDYLPAIGRSAKAPNLLYAFGHQHLGLTLAAVTAELVVALADGTAPPLSLKAFDLARF